MSLAGAGLAVDAVMGIVNRIWPDKTEAEKARLAAELSAMQAQIEVNKTEAASASMFVAGWRPFIGWTCGAAFAWQFVVAPMLVWGASLVGISTKLPDIDVATIIPLLIAMLGLGAYRTYEKRTGTEGNR